MKSKLTRFGLVAGTAIAAASLVACGGSDSQSYGTLGVSMTDAPACGFEAVNVTVQKVRVHKSSTANENDSGWTDITLSPAKKVNLLDLTNGVLMTLGEVPLPTGHYTQLRLVLDANTGNSMANSVVPVGGSETALDTPSGVQTGIKLVNQFEVKENERVDLVLDFDACKSVVTKGAANKFALKPVVKVIPTLVNGITGFVAPELVGGNVLVTAQQNGNVVSATAPTATGEFMLARLLPGNYDVVVTADNKAAAVISTVPVATDTSTTNLSTSGAPIALVDSAMASIGGTASLSPSSTTESALVSAKQSFASGPTVTIKYKNADIVNGSYSIDNLPVAAPQYAVYSATAPLAFAPATTVAPGVGKYKVEASASGYATKVVESVDVSTQSATGVNFTLNP